VSPKMDEAHRQRVRELNVELEAAIENDRYTLDTNLMQARILLSIIKIGSVIVMSNSYENFSGYTEKELDDITHEIKICEGFTNAYPEMGVRLMGDLDKYQQVVRESIQGMKNGLVARQLRELMDKEDEEGGP